MTINISTLTAIAQAATPGEWQLILNEQELDDEGQPSVYNVLGPPDPNEPARYGAVRIIETDCGHYPPRYADARHIAAFSPSTCLALLDRIRQLEAALVEAAKLTNEADAALAEIISEGQHNMTIPSSPSWRDTPIGKARLRVVAVDDILRKLSTPA